MKTPQINTWKERRKSHDTWFYLKNTLALLGWILFLVALVMSYYAAPETNYGVIRYYDIDIRQFWLTPMTGYLYILLWFSALASYVALLIRKYRSRRRIDNPEYNLIFLLSMNLVWLIYLLYQLNIIES